MYANNPQTVDRIDQIDAMRMGVDYSFTIKCRNFSMQCRPVSIGENNEIVARIATRLASLTSFERQTITEHTMLAYETLTTASTSSQGANDPKISEYILSRCTPDELHYLFKQYVLECDKVNPSLELLTPQQLKEVVAVVKKSPPDELVSQVTALSFSELASLSLAYLQSD